MTCPLYGYWVQWANPLTPKPGCGTTRTWDTVNAPLWIPGGRQRPAAIWHYTIARADTYQARLGYPAFPGIQPVVLRENGTPANVNEGGYLCIKKPWPGLMRTVYGDPSRFKSTYFERFPGYYTAGDAARIDEDGYFWLMGRIDDVIKVSGHRIGTAEIESALVSHEKVSEAAVACRAPRY